MRRILPICLLAAALGLPPACRTGASGPARSDFPDWSALMEDIGIFFDEEVPKVLGSSDPDLRRMRKEAGRLAAGLDLGAGPLRPAEGGEDFARHARKAAGFLRSLAEAKTREDLEPRLADFEESFCTPCHDRFR